MLCYKFSFPILFHEYYLLCEEKGVVLARQVVIVLALPFTQTHNPTFTSNKSMDFTCCKILGDSWSLNGGATFNQPSSSILFVISIVLLLQ